MPTIIDRSEIKNYVGKETGPSAWHTITQQQINQFADCTLDHQFIHVDPERAKASPFGTTIAHGFLSLSMLSHLSEGFNLLIDGVYMGVNSGFDKVRFLAPVKAGKRVRGHARILSIEETRAGQYRFKTEVTVEIEDEDKPALVAEWITIQMVRDGT